MFRRPLCVTNYDVCYFECMLQPCNEFSFLYIALVRIGCNNQTFSIFNETRNGVRNDFTLKKEIAFVSGFIGVFCEKCQMAFRSFL